MALPDRHLAFLLVALLPLASACSKSAAAESTITSSSSVAPAPRPPEPPPRTADSAPTVPEGMQSIPERFASEAKSRPTGTVRVEDVLAAFSKSGAAVREQRQHLGAPFLAAYCVGGQAGDDLHFSVCEYANVDRAKEGKAMSEQAFGAVAHRTLYTNGATTLTLRVGSSKDRELGEKLARTFAALSPGAK